MKNNKLSVLIALIFIAISSSSYGQLNMTFRSNHKFPGKNLSNIWGYADSVGNEYALVGTSTGMTIVDVTNPDSVFEKFSFPGVNSIWREVRTHQDYAYYVSQDGGGVKIVDMTLIHQDSVRFKTWKPVFQGDSVNIVHALQITDGFLYLYGSNAGTGSAIFVDLADPWNPVIVGGYSGDYIHDGYVRNDTMYAAHVYDGYVSIIEVADKQNPGVLATQETPGLTSHNTWLSDNSRYMFTTDEVDDSYLTAYDILDLNNITETDRVQVTPGSGSVVYNTYIKNDYAVTSWYKDGVVIVDVSRPHNIVVTAHYDTSPLAGPGMQGDWGVYPYLPSGNLLISDMEEGLFVLTPSYVRAAYLEGLVTEAGTGTPVNGALITVSGVSGGQDNSDLSGNYALGSSTGGTYTMVVSMAGYLTQTLSITLTNGVVKIQNIELVKEAQYTVTGFVTEAGDVIMPVVGVNVLITNNDFTYNAVTDAAGNFSIPNVFGGNYDVIIGKWGYKTMCQSQLINQSDTSVFMFIPKGYYDDFTFNYGWTTTLAGSSGRWEREVPIGTLYDVGVYANPNRDASVDCGNVAFTTGNSPGGPYDNDVDNGYTTLSSPVFDLVTGWGHADPLLSFSRWFFNAEGSIANPNDSMYVFLDNGNTRVGLDTLAMGIKDSTWNRKSLYPSSRIALTTTMRLIVKIIDVPDGHLLEGGFDHFEITDTSTVGIREISRSEKIDVYPNPFNDQIHIDLTSASKDCMIDLVDIAGKVIFTSSLRSGNNLIRIPADVTSGIYVVRIREASTIRSVSRIIKQ